MNFLQKTGNRIKLIRISAGISQKELAGKLEIPASLLSFYEKGHREVPLRFIKKFCDYFNLPITQFFNLIDEKTAGKHLDKDMTNIIEELNKTLIALEQLNITNKEKSSYVSRLST